MPQIKTIVRGDSYVSTPLFIIKIVDDNAQPLNLSGYTIRTTFKTTASSAASNPNDEDAALAHTLILDADGAEVFSKGLKLSGIAAQGEINEYLSREESLGLPLDTPIYSDIELTSADGDVQTWIMESTLVAREGFTNRTTEPQNSNMVSKAQLFTPSMEGGGE